MIEEEIVGEKVERRGRPLGTQETPQGILRKELKEAAGVNKRVRDFIYTCMDFLEQEVRKDASMDTRLKIIEILGSLASTASKGMGELARHIPALEESKGGRGDVEGERSVEDIMKELQGKR